MLKTEGLNDLYRLVFYGKPNFIFMSKQIFYDGCLYNLECADFFTTSFFLLSFHYLLRFPVYHSFILLGTLGLWTAEGETLIKSVTLWGGIVIRKDTFSCQAVVYLNFSLLRAVFLPLPRMWRVQHACPQAVRPFHAIYCIHTHTHDLSGDARNYTVICISREPA